VICLTCGIYVIVSVIPKDLKTGIQLEGPVRKEEVMCGECVGQHGKVYGDSYSIV
jgi:hypothetical protein